jgi:acyl-CoA thioester hydrolase
MSKNKDRALLRRRKNGYFERVKGTPEPVSASIKRRVRFSEADIMGISWHGRYPEFFEEASAVLGRKCNLTYKDFYNSNLKAPIVQFHIDYYLPLMLDEEFTVTASLIWNEGARLNTEFVITKKDNNIAATGYTIQMFTDAISGEVIIASPDLLEKCRRRWMSGEIK